MRETRALSGSIAPEEELLVSLVRRKIACGPVLLTSTRRHAARAERRLDFVGTEIGARGESHRCAQIQPEPGCGGLSYFS